MRAGRLAQGKGGPAGFVLGGAAAFMTCNPSDSAPTLRADRPGGRLLLRARPARPSGPAGPIGRARVARPGERVVAAEAEQRRRRLGRDIARSSRIASAGRG